jgi:ankyrin repeat protein
MERRPVYYIDHGDLGGLMAALRRRPETISFTDVGGQSLLHAAAGRKVPLDFAKELIRCGIDVDRQDQNGATPLVYAASLGRTDVAKVIRGAGGRLDIADKHGNQPLWYAVGHPRSDTELIEFLIREGADPNYKNRYGKSPLSIARERKLESLRSILEGGVPPKTTAG